MSETVKTVGYTAGNLALTVVSSIGGEALAEGLFEKNPLLRLGATFLFAGTVAVAAILFRDKFEPEIQRSIRTVMNSAFRIKTH